MKNFIITLILVLSCTSGFTQNFRFEYTGGFMPKVNKDNLNNVHSTNDFAPGLWRNLQVNYDVRQELELRKKTDFTQVYSINPQDYNYDNIVKYVSVEISAFNNGKLVSAQNGSNPLTPEQKKILKNADPGTDVNIKVRFRFKYQAGHKPDDAEVFTGTYALTVVPSVEAEYPGGYKQLSDYFNQHVFNKISENEKLGKVLLASVKFTVNEDGRISNAQIAKSSSDLQLDKLILNETNKMPKWNPARNAEGVKIKQEVSIPFGGGNGC